MKRAPKRKPRTTREFVRDRLSDGKDTESIWRELGAGWNYISRLAREWKAEQEELRATLTLTGKRKPK